MENIRKVHCFFEQSGTFKNEFIKLGIPAEDYDIQNNFGQTDHTDDLFKAIEDAYDGKPSIFDNIKGGQDGDLIMAFFPCIYFSCMSQMMISWTHKNYKNMDARQKTEKILERSAERERFFRLAVKLHSICYQRNIRMIMENPWSEQTFLKQNFITNPSIIDMDRTRRGDAFVKPTAYWFINCENTTGYSYQQAKRGNKICQSKPAIRAGLCSEDRSLITTDYARNFICDFILGRRQPDIDPQLFD